MSIPGFLLLEVRLAFRTCNPHRSAFTRAQFSTLQPLLKRPATPPSRIPPRSIPPKNDSKAVSPRPEPSIVDESKKLAGASASSSSTELTERRPDTTSVAHRQRSDVPMRILPKAQVSEDMTLSSQERMQLEWMTRRMPKRQQGQPFKERLLIYHGGLTRTNLVSIVKIATLSAVAFVAMIAAPAYYNYGSPWWTIALIVAGAFVPFGLVAWTSRPYVNWIHLVLPTFARQSPKAALEYSKNLPANALVHISFMRSTALPSHVEANIADLVPAQSFWRPVTFKWVGRRVEQGPWYRRNPTEFYVSPHSGKGKEVRDTIPGVWENVYKRIAGIESDAVAKWRR